MQFSIWTYMPHVAIVARLILAAALVLLALSPMVRPAVRDARQHAALAAALLIGGQLLLGYWFYSYLTWCYPLLVIAVIQAPREHRERQGHSRTILGVSSRCPWRRLRIPHTSNKCTAPVLRRRYQ